MFTRNMLKTITCAPKFYFGTLVNCSYPYQFGGIQNKTNNFQQSQLFKQMFGHDVTQGFKQAFISILGGLKDKDKQFLSQILQKSLIQKIQFIDVDLVNQSSPLQANIYKSKFVLGGEFARTPVNREVISMKNDQQHGFQILFNKNNIKPGNMKIPILFACEVYFTGKTKLNRKGQQKNLDKIQSHMLQFQIGNYISMMQLVGLMSNLEKLSMQKQSTQKILNALIGKNYQWKIGDIDKSLKGNFVNKGNGFSGLF